MNLFNSRNTNNTLTSLLLSVIFYMLAVAGANAQYSKSTLNPPPPVPDKSAVTGDNTSGKKRSVKMRYGVHPTVPENYDDLKEGEYYHRG